MNELWPDAFVEEANLSQNIFMLRKALGDTPEDRRYIVTLPGKGYRFVAEVRTVTQDGEDVIVASRSRSADYVEHTRHGSRRNSSRASRRPARRTELETRRGNRNGGCIAGCSLSACIFIARTRDLGREGLRFDRRFHNTTGDPVFDGALRQGLEIQLEQSPFLV